MPIKQDKVMRLTI